MNRVLMDGNNKIEFRVKLFKGEKIDYAKTEAMQLEYREGQLIPKLSKSLEDEADTYLLSRLLEKVIEDGKEIKLEKGIIGTCKFLREQCLGTEKLIDEMLLEVKAVNFTKNEVELPKISESEKGK